MLYVIRTSWPLLLGMLLLLAGNGLQGTLLGIRGAIEGYDAATMSLVMSAYYVGFLLGSRRVYHGPETRGRHSASPIRPLCRSGDETRRRLRRLRRLRRRPQ